jgi:hypothetical protein
MHTWHESSFAPDSRTLFCSVSTGSKYAYDLGEAVPGEYAFPNPAGPTELNAIIAWDLVGNTWKSMMRSHWDGVEHVPIVLETHPLVRPMRLFSLNSTGMINVWASKMVQDWTIIEPHWDYYESNKVYHEKEDDFDDWDAADVSRRGHVRRGHPYELGPGEGEEDIEID